MVTTPIIPKHTPLAKNLFYKIKAANVHLPHCDHYSVCVSDYGDEFRLTPKGCEYDGFLITGLELKFCTKMDGTVAVRSSWKKNGDQLLSDKWTNTSLPLLQAAQNWKIIFNWINGNSSVPCPDVLHQVEVAGTMHHYIKSAQGVVKQIYLYLGQSTMKVAG